MQEGSVAACSKRSPHESPSIYCGHCSLNCIIWHFKLLNIPPHFLSFNLLSHCCSFYTEQYFKVKKKFCPCKSAANPLLSCASSFCELNLDPNTQLLAVGFPLRAKSC